MRLDTFNFVLVCSVRRLFCSANVEVTPSPLYIPSQLAVRSSRHIRFTDIYVYISTKTDYSIRPNYKPMFIWITVDRTNNKWAYMRWQQNKTKLYDHVTCMAPCPLIETYAHWMLHGCFTCTASGFACIGLRQMVHVRYYSMGCFADLQQLKNIFTIGLRNRLLFFKWRIWLEHESTKVYPVYR